MESKNFIEEVFYGNIDPQEKSIKKNRRVRREMKMLSENEEIMPSPEDVLGNCLDSSGFRHDRNTLLCVRNPRRSTDYKIIKVFHSYSDKDIR